MKISDHGIQFIKDREGKRLTAYRDQKGVPTIGYGHTHGVKMGDVITDNQATLFLLQDLQDAENAINSHVNVTLTQNQFDALTSFVFNIGEPHFFTSTLLKVLNQKQYLTAANEFLKWDKIHIDGRLIEDHGLKLRRELESQLFVS